MINMIKKIMSAVRTTDLKKIMAVLLATGALGFTVILVGVPFWAFALESGRSNAGDWMRNEKHSWHLKGAASAPTKEKADQYVKPERGIGSWLMNEKHVWHLSSPKKPVPVEKKQGEAPLGPSWFANEKHSWHMKPAKSPELSNDGSVALFPERVQYYFRQDHRRKNQHRFG